MTTKSQFVIRGVPDSLIQAIEREAEANMRSREKQMLWILAQHVIEPSVRAAHIQSVAARLNRALTNVNYLSGLEHWSPLVVAEQAGFEQGGTVLEAFDGTIELTFSQLERIARTLAVSPEWLKHGGKYSPYSWPFWRWEGTPQEIVDQLITSDKGIVKAIRFLRTDNTSGSLSIVRELEDAPRYEAFHTPYHISEEIGGGGERDLKLVFEVLALLYKSYPRVGWNLQVTSHLLPPEDVKVMTEVDKQVHPISVAYHSTTAPWWEDIWDPKMMERNEYWKGQAQFSRRIVALMGE